MKEKMLSMISVTMVLIPWTILILRKNAWALESPIAEIMIACYAAFMIFSGIFTIISYSRAGVQNSLMKICVIINGLYAVVGTGALGQIILSKIM